jgi:AcrR family transcriptional regulator
MNQRTARKAATREKTIAAAKALWREPGSYGINGIREVAAMIDMSTGAVFSNFDTKDDLWRAAFDCEPPIDGVLTRAAPDLFKALQDLVDAMSVRPEDQPLYPALVAATLLDRVKDQLLDEEAARSATVEAEPSVPALDMAA